MSPLAKLYIALILLFLQLPIVVLIVYSFNASKSRGVWTGVTLDWYAEMLADSNITEALVTTLVCGLLAALISTVIGTMAALGLNSMKRRAYGLTLAVAYIPMLNAEIVMGISLMMLYTMLGMELGFVTLLLSHITFCLPYVILSVMPKVRQFDYSRYEAALDLGASPSYAIQKIVMPDLAPGIISGFLLSLTLSIDDFVISFFTTGNGVNNLSTIIYTMTKRGISPKLNALSAIVYVVILALLIGINVLPKKDDGNKPHKRLSERNT